MRFRIIEPITAVEIIAVGKQIRDLEYLQQTYGKGRWRKLKGVALIELSNGRIRLAELHWNEAHGIGKVDLKRKRFVD